MITLLKFFLVCIFFFFFPFHIARLFLLCIYIYFFFCFYLGDAHKRVATVIEVE